VLLFCLSNECVKFRFKAIRTIPSTSSSSYQVSPCTIGLTSHGKRPQVILFTFSSLWSFLYSLISCLFLPNILLSALKYSQSMFFPYVKRQV
jgi:hypothetical protein